MQSIDLAGVKAILNDLSSMAAAQRDHFIELDGVMGDSDLGLTMVRVLAAGADNAQVSAETDLGRLLAQAGMAMAKAAPSTMGTLVATGFMRGGKALRDKAAIGPQEYLTFWRAFTDGIMERGGAKPGDKTVVDALDPACRAIEAGLADGADLPTLAARAAAAARDGVEATRTMVAQHGRAAYHGENSRRAQDPGATVASAMLDVFAARLAVPG